jgi:hypothetical protein
MENFKVDDRKFYQLMQKSRLAMPFSDFEDKMMQKIHQEAGYRKSIFQDIKLSTFFFIIGTLFGIMVTLLLPKLDGSFFGISSNALLLPFQVIFIILFLTQLEDLIKLVRNYIK